MAVYLDIEKTAASAAFVEYEFRTVDERSGVLRIDLRSGKVELQRMLPGDKDGGLFARASHKVSKAWEDGELPDKLCWAS